MKFSIIILLDTPLLSLQYDLEKNQLLVLVFLSESNFPFLDFLSLIKIVLGKNLVLGKKIVSTGQFFVFVDIWALPGDSWFLILLIYWNSPYKIDPYDAYIIFEQHLGAMWFAKKMSKNINAFWSLEA